MSNDGLEGYDDIDTSGLTEEEAAALRDTAEEDPIDEVVEEEAEEEVAEEEAAEEEAAEEEATEEATEEEEQEPEESETEETVEAAEQEAEQEEVSPEEAERDPFVPLYEFKGEEGDLEAVSKQLAEIDTKFEEGELSATQYREAVAALQTPLIVAQAQKSAMEEMTRQNSEQLWGRQQQEFFDLYPKYRDSKVLYAGLEASLSDLYAQEDNAGKSGQWFLREAKTLVDKEMGLEEIPQTAQRARSAKPDVPTTLADVPSADAEQTGDRYSALDKLEGLDLEIAVAKMSEDESASYLRTR